MKSLIDSLFIAVSMYSVFPVPVVEWNSRNMRNAMCFFPLISLLCGAGLFAVWKICIFLGINSFMFGVLAVFVNVFLTGGIHIDGFCDTADALFSRRSQAEKLKILKDPHCGSFAVLSIIMVLMISAAAYSQIYDKLILMPCIMLVFAVSRSLSGISVVKFRCTDTSSLAKTFGSGAGKNSGYILTAELILSYVILLFINYKAFLVILTISLLTFVYYYRISMKDFGGITGDLAGYFLVLCETLCILAVSLFGGVIV